MFVDREVLWSARHGTCAVGGGNAGERSSMLIAGVNQLSEPFGSNPTKSPFLRRKTGARFASLLRTNPIHAAGRNEPT